MNLDEIMGHMQERNFAANGVFKGQLADETRAQARERVLSQLADDVPDLVGEVQRLNLQNREMIDHLGLAWGVIANAGGGNWKLEGPKWEEAAVMWRDQWHAILSKTQKPLSEGPSAKIISMKQEAHGYAQAVHFENPCVCKVPTPKKVKTIHGGIVESQECAVCGAECPIRAGEDLTLKRKCAGCDTMPSVEGGLCDECYLAKFGKERG